MNLNRYKNMVFSLTAGGLLLVGAFLSLNGAPQIALAGPGDLFISPTASGDCSQGSPCDLQTALGASTDGDTLYMAEGVYTGSGGAVITVTNSIAIYGGWDGTTTTPVVRDPGAYPTSLNGDDTRRVLYISGHSSPTIDGLIITGGKAPDGGGVYIYDASPIIQNNVIRANRTVTAGTYEDGRGGGIFVGGVSNAIIAQNRILSNTSGYGGGVYHNGTTTISITANEIVGNVTSHRGGGIVIVRSPDMVQANVISGNTAAGDGGGMLIWDAAPQVEANRIVGNSAASGGGISMGNNATPSLLNNLLISNTQDGVLITSSSPVMINNTIVGSGPSDSGEGICLLSSSSCSPPYCTTGKYMNNIVVSYEVGIYGSGPIDPVIDYNDVWGNTTDYSLPAGVVSGTHNISLDPLFTNPAADDYHLQSGSPCINAGDNEAQDLPATDIEGNPRISCGTVDMGAYEVLMAEIYVAGDGLCAGSTPCFSRITDAIACGSVRFIIKVTQGTFPEAVLLDEAKLIDLQAGWNNTFTTLTGHTGIKSLTLRDGAFKLDNGCLVVGE